MLTESWVEGKSVEEKDAQPTERTATCECVTITHIFHINPFYIYILNHASILLFIIKSQYFRIYQKKNN